MCSLSFVSIVSRRSKILLMSCPWDRITPSMIVVFSSVSRMCVAVSFLIAANFCSIAVILSYCVGIGICLSLLFNSENIAKHSAYRPVLLYHRLAMLRR